MTAPAGQLREARASRQPISKWKKLLFALIATTLFFASLEFVLALAGVKPFVETDDPFVGFTKNLPLFVEGPGRAGQAALVTADNKLPWFNKQDFARIKPAGTFRIFCLGGSTTYGRPYEDLTSFPGWLREILPVDTPETNFEVINAGGVSYASYRIANLVEELVEYQPDLFIVCMGHNEFLEHRSYGDLQIGTGSQEIRSVAVKFRTYTLMHRLLKSDVADKRFQMKEEVDEILNQTAGPQSYRRNPTLRAQIRTHFEFNCQRIISIARNSGVDVLLVAPACNVKDCAPFKSEHRADLSPDDLQKWDTLIEMASRFEAADNSQEALAAYGKAVQLDDRHAQLHYRRGKLLFRLRRFAEASVAFERAREEDICSLRILTDFKASLMTIAAELDIAMIDFELQLQRECLLEHGHITPGTEYFYDHVHPRIEVNRLLAVSIVDAMRTEGWIASKTKLTDQRLVGVAAKIESRVDLVAHARALRNLAKVLNWSGKHTEAGPLAIEALETIPNDPEALMLAGSHFERTSEFKKAVVHYRAALEGYPEAAEVHHRLASVLVKCDRLKAAVPHFQEVTRLRSNDAEAHYNLGKVILELGQRSKAIMHFEKALKINSKHSRSNKALNDLAGSR